jgi:4-hydroxybenzoate polyprenyltransferase
LRLGLSMMLLQFAIGALNDIVDATADAGRVPPKPIPGGIITTTEARVLAAASGTIGLALAAPSGPALLVLAVVVLAVGAAYDLFAKGTAWSWLPFAIGIPLLPVFGVVGSIGSLPGSFAILIPMAVMAGAGLAVANARGDLDVDAAAGTTSVATTLGPRWSWWVDAGLLGGATVLGLIFVGRSGWTAFTVGLVIVGTALVGAGLLLGRRAAPGARRRAWEVQAIGAAIAATGWVAGMIPGP